MTGMWGALGQQPLLWIAATLAAYAVGDGLARKAGRHPLVNPVLIGVALMMGLLVASGTSYDVYASGVQPIQFLLGPATVALALPIRDNLHHVRRAALPLLAALVAGSVTAAVVAVGIGWAFGLNGDILASVAPKAATAPVAMGIAETLGGIPPLTAGLVILTGMTGAILVSPLMNALRIRDWRARGFAVGVAAHGIGTARALQVNPLAGAFAGLGMGLNAILTAFVAPWALRVFQ
ncbi:LrgB family protein [Falsirhodobacter sp. 20TX0035]|uniref:LrgB family protein n=1 Tax=Falsirhodobacter sp. 20TX0035 TaxID=3022019 RepID=UPI00232CA541|nr:LrgB family protein [Falsirhodobacter sp. 20TX0035]MDB6455173.1 LrgB family protein [Falsirhodobacter sp. 20TX0035]